MTNIFNRGVRATLIASAVMALLNACGQKGPLYLPDANGTVVTRPTQSQPTQSQPTSPQPQSQAAPQSSDQSASPVDTEKNRKTPPQ